MKKQAFIGEMENGYWVETPANGKRWMFAELPEGLAKVAELMEPVEKEDPTRWMKPTLEEATTIVEE